MATVSTPGEHNLVAGSPLVVMPAAGEQSMLHVTMPGDSQDTGMASIKIYYSKCHRPARDVGSSVNPLSTGADWTNQPFRPFNTYRFSY